MERFLRALDHQIKYIYDSDHWEFASGDIYTEQQLVDESILKANKDQVREQIRKSFQWLENKITNQILWSIEEEF
jgi:replication-associated recombination protein RarA